MKAKYLIQIQTTNQNIGATGWCTLDGTMTKAAADERAADFRHARPVTDLRAVRVISASKYGAELRDYNRAAFRAAAFTYTAPGTDRNAHFN